MTSLLTLAGLLLVSAFVSHVLIRPVRRLGLALGLVDHPSWRRAHREAVPCSGGIAIYLAAVLCGVALAATVGLPFRTPALLSLGVAGLLTLVLGVVDDRFGVHAEKKLLGQIVVVLLPMASGLTLRHIALPGVGDVQLGVLAWPVTLFWYLGFINSINLIDGLDGLAGGIAAVVLGSVLLAVAPGDPVAGAWVVVLLGSLLGFLRSNLSRSRIFLGDAGSMLLGLWMAGFTLGLARQAPSVPCLAIAAMVVPIVDTATTIVRRLGRRVSIFRADDEHLHHRLLRLGAPAPRAVATLWLLTLAGAAAGAALHGQASAGVLALGAFAAVTIELACTLPQGERPTLAEAVRYLLWLPGAWLQDRPQPRLAEVIEMHPYRSQRSQALRKAKLGAASAGDAAVADAPLATAARLDNVGSSAALSASSARAPRTEPGAASGVRAGEDQPASEELDVLLAVTEDPR